MIKWPPPELEPVYKLHRTHAAWYSGDMARLAAVYSDSIYRGTARSYFWAQDTDEEVRTCVHLPIAADISAVSAKLLFKEHPIVTVTNKKTQKRLNAILKESGAYMALLEAASNCSALGGVYLKVNWDSEVAPHPIIRVGQSDAAVPEFRLGVLTACTFWRVVASDDKAIYRHLERHEKGVILNTLFRGTADKLGEPVPLESLPQTAGLVDAIPTGASGLSCVYIPNVRPNRKDRSSELGMSDYDGVEPLMDSADQAWTSLMTDLELGQARLQVPETMIPYKDGQAGRFDKFKKIYVGLHTLTSNAPLKDQIIPSQMLIRTTDHLALINALMRSAYQGAGYSPGSFGLDSETGAAESGRALLIRERKSFDTAALKAEYWTPPLESILHALLEIDKEHFRSGISPERPSVTIQDSVRTDLADVAPAVSMLRTAGAMSVEQAVRAQHNDWEESAVEAEVKKILSEQGLIVPDVIEKA